MIDLADDTILAGSFNASLPKGSRYGCFFPAGAMKQFEVHFH